MILFNILEKTVLVYNDRKQIIGFLGAIVVIKGEGTQISYGNESVIYLDYVIIVISK